MKNSSTRSWESPFPSRITPDLIKKWTTTYPTPFYVYDLETIQKRIQEVKNFPRPTFSSFTPRYAVKANSNRTLIGIFEKAGLHFDSSSSFEVERLLKIGICPDKIILTTQQLPTDKKKFKNLFNQGLIFNATSLKQLEWYGQLCPNSFVSLRINPGFGSGMNIKTIVGGMDSGFGIWHEYYPKVIKLCEHYNLNVNRIHTHVGSGSNPKTWEAITVFSLKLLKFFPSAKILNLGGGFKVARHPKERSGNLNVIGKKVSNLIKNFSMLRSRIFDLEIEPGTYFIAEAGLLVTQIEDVTTTGIRNRKQFIKLNCGMNDLIRPALYHTRHHIDIVPLSSRSMFSKKKSYIVIGHCCESGDLISQHANETRNSTNKATMSFFLPQSGDPVIIHSVGAYGSSMSSRYNSYPLIAEYLYTGKKSLQIIRKTETLDDIIDKEVKNVKVNNLKKRLKN